MIHVHCNGMNNLKGNSYGNPWFMRLEAPAGLVTRGFTIVTYSNRPVGTLMLERQIENIVVCRTSERRWKHTFKTVLCLAYLRSAAPGIYMLSDGGDVKILSPELPTWYKGQVIVSGERNSWPPDERLEGREIDAAEKHGWRGDNIHANAGGMVGERDELIKFLQVVQSYGTHPTRPHCGQWAVRMATVAGCGVVDYRSDIFFTTWGMTKSH